MAIMKLSASLNAVTFIDDEGNVFITSRQWVENLLEGNVSRKFILLTRMPLKAAKNRFKPSPVLDVKTKQKVEATNTSNDVFSKKVQDEQKQEKSYEDKKVWK